jgi:nicotinate-nucleotide adenylyltransferase
MDTHAKRIGILGGCFNPIHLGHLILAENARQVFELDQVLFIPCGTPAHKSTAGLIPAANRLAMIRLAIADNPAFVVSEIETARDGISYAVDTVSTLRKMEPDTEFCFIIGADSLMELYLWRHIYTLLTLCRFLTFCRPGIDLSGLRPEDLRLDPPWGERLIQDIRQGRLIDISSSNIRHRAAEGLSIRYLVPEAVARYITEYKLYC